MSKALNLLAFTVIGFLAGLSFYRSDAPAVAAVRRWMTSLVASAPAKGGSAYRFKGKSDDSDVTGGISTWSDGTLHVTLKVADKAYGQEIKAQSAAAYERNDAGLETKRITVSNKDHSAVHEKATALIDAVR